MKAISALVAALVITATLALSAARAVAEGNETVSELGVIDSNKSE